MGALTVGEAKPGTQGQPWIQTLQILRLQPHSGPLGQEPHDLSRNIALPLAQGVGRPP